MNWFSEHKTKILGTATTVIATMLSMIALGMFGADASSPALLEPTTIRWMTIILSLVNVALGGGTVMAGYSNSANMRVAQARAEVAAAIDTALHTPVPSTQPKP